MLPTIYIEIPTYGLFSTIGLLVAMVFIYARMDNVSLSIHELIIYICICSPLTLLVARLFFVISMFPKKGFSLDKIWYYLINGGIVFYGGLFGVLLGIVLSSLLLKKDILIMLDFAAPAIPLFHFFARIGCLFAGCCYGIPSHFGIMNLGEDIVRFPVQLLESIVNALIFILIIVFDLKHNSYKYNLHIYLISYSICRFLIEFLRGDSIRGIWFGIFSTAQIISFFIWIFECTWMLGNLSKKPVINHEL